MKQKTKTSVVELSQLVIFITKDVSSVAMKARRSFKDFKDLLTRRSC
jgi:hypothetical protein